MSGDFIKDDTQFLGLPLDQFVVLACHFSCIPVSIGLHYASRSYNLSTLSRERFCALYGLIILVICFHWDVLHMLAQCFVSYLLYKLIDRSRLGFWTFVVTYGQVLVCNAVKFLYEDDQYKISYETSLMLGTMKLSSLAFALQDGMMQTRKNSSKTSGDTSGDPLTDMQKRYVIEDELSFHDFASYYLSFYGILFGPFIFYRDYKQFMLDGPRHSIPWTLAIKTLMMGLLGGVIFHLSTPQYGVLRNIDDDVLSSGQLVIHYMLYVTMIVAKCKYYFAWLTAESVCLFGGLGVDSHDLSKRLDVVATVDPIAIELTTSVKSFIDNWNVFTSRWLRYVAYERSGRHGALVAFLLSACWHGYYSGYLLLFVPLLCYSFLGRKLHRNLRPRFQATRAHKVFYAVITWIGTAACISFNGLAFQLLHADRIFTAQSALYYWPHVVAVVLYLAVPSSKKSGPTQSATRSHVNEDRKLG